MRDITQLKQTYLDTLRQTCRAFKDGVCQARRCSCDKRAEVYAMVRANVPDSYLNCNIDHFTGFCDGVQVLPVTVVSTARDAVKKYTWENIQDGEEYADNWIFRSALPKRRINGASLIIYGDPRTYAIQKGVPVTSRRKLGRTMLAAVVLKEAIFQRWLPGHAADQYAWVSYNTLVNRLMEKANGNTQFDADLARYEDADWLVVDGLEIKEDAARAFRANVLDKFFSERAEANLPNILVFQDDLSRYDDLQQDFGSAINSIIHSRKTHKVCLIDYKNTAESAPTAKKKISPNLD